MKKLLFITTPITGMGFASHDDLHLEWECNYGYCDLIAYSETIINFIQLGGDFYAVEEVELLGTALYGDFTLPWNEQHIIVFSLIGDYLFLDDPQPILRVYGDDLERACAGSWGGDALVDGRGVCGGEADGADGNYDGEDAACEDEYDTGYGSGLLDGFDDGATSGNLNLRGYHNVSDIVLAVELILTGQ